MPQWWHTVWPCRSSCENPLKKPIPMDTQKEIKETLEDMSENPIVNKIKPRRSKISRQEPTTTYEYEYNEIDEHDENEINE